MRFTMAKRGSVFSTRDRSVLVLAELEQELAATGDGELILDFTGVTNISDSFADGFVGVLVSQRRSLGLSDPQLVEMTPFVKSVVDSTLRLRGLAFREPVAA